MATRAIVRNILLPASDVTSAVAFYRDALGLAVKFEDGDRYAALDGGDVTVAIAGGAEDVTGGVVAPSFRVDDVGAAVEAVITGGGELVRPAHEGPHEVRAVVRDPHGNVVVLYASR